MTSLSLCRSQNETGNVFGPTEGTCNTNWFYTSCYQEAFVVDFTTADFIVGLVSTIGAGVVIVCVGTLVYFCRRAILRDRATREFVKYLEAYQRSCSQCGDMVATMQCQTCNTLLCNSCAARNKVCSKGDIPHKLNALHVEGEENESHYQSFAHLAYQQTIDDLDDDSRD